MNYDVIITAKSEHTELPEIKRSLPSCRVWVCDCGTGSVHIVVTQQRRRDVIIAITSVT